MRPDRMTTKSQEAFRSASDLASRRGNPEIVPEHLILAMLDQDEGVALPLFRKAGGDPDALKRKVEEYLAKLPQVSGGGAEPTLSRRTMEIIRKGEDEAKTLKDDFVLRRALSARACQARPRNTGRLRGLRWRSLR